MMQKHTTATFPIGHPRVWAGIALSLLFLACITGTEHDKTGRHEWAGSNGIVVPHDSFPSDCSLCHVAGSWSKLRDDFDFDHGLETGVSLAGAHAQAQCLRCHNDRGPVARFSALGCSGCHEDVHRAELGGQCASCHGEQTWALRDEIALHNKTRFPLIGSHAAAQCWTCHPSGEVGNWSRVDVNCITCHGDEALAVASPNHLSNGWTNACDRCHIPTTWNGAGFNHSSFALTGAHARADCSACHAGGIYTGIPTDCAGCHTQDYLDTTDPDHALAGFPTACDLCHDTNSWEGAIFSHAGIGSGCISCHQQQYDSTTDPNHSVAGFSTACEQCHTTNAWVPSNFNHNFPINNGDHSGFACIDCHLQPNSYRVFSCIDCHPHNRADMGNEHMGVRGYAWSSPACYGCHPDGND